MKKIVFFIAMLVLTTTAFSQECFKFSRQPFFSGPAANGKFSLNINFDNNGNKAVGIVVKCGSSIILDTCFIGMKTGTAVFSGLECPGGFGSLSASFTLRAGGCNSAICDSLKLEASGGPLPVKLSSFSAVRSKQIVSLNWSTEFEIGTKEFIVERAEGTQFRSLGTININGNSSTKKSYSFNDKNENTGNTYYRLKNVDLDGKFTYSQIRTVKGIGVVNDVTVFPNPARSNSKISIVGVTANSSIQLLDFSGKVLKNINSNTVNLIDLSGVKNGTYLIRILDKSTNEVVNKKLTVSN